MIKFEPPQLYIELENQRGEQLPSPKFRKNSEINSVDGVGHTLGAIAAPTSQEAEEDKSCSNDQYFSF